MNPEDRRFLELQFKEIRNDIQKMNRAIAILLTRTTPVIGE